MRASSPRQLARPHRAASQNLQCNFCGIIFIKVEHLQRHQRRHTGERPYPCLTCGKRFSRRDVLSRHKQVHVPKENTIQSVSSYSGAGELGTVTVTEDGGGALMVPLKAPASHSSCRSGLPANRDPEICVNEPWISATLGDFPFEDLPSPVEVNGKDKSGDFQADLFEQLDFVLSGDSLSLHNGYYIDGSTVGPEHQPDFGLTEPSANYDQPPRTTHLHSQVSVSEVESFCDQNSCSPRSQLSVFTFDKIQTIWDKTRVHTTTPAGRLWQAVLDHPEDNIISMINSHSDVLQKPSNQVKRFNWGFDDECRSRILDEYHGILCDNEYRLVNTDTGGQSIPPLPSLMKDDRKGSVTDLPNTDFLETCLDYYFYHVHDIEPFMHVATFNARKTPTASLLAMCMLGYMTMNFRAPKWSFNDCLEDILDRCLVQLRSTSDGKHLPSRFLQDLCSAYLLTMVGVVSGKGSSWQCQTLYQEAILAGIRHGLFYQNDIKDEVVAPLPPNAPCEWKWSRWCRVECIRRLINCLFMMDALYSSILETSPLIPPNKAAFNLPASPKLFNATSVLEWKRNLDGELPGLTQPGSNIRAVPINLPATDGSVCDFGVQALLFAIWMHVAEGTQRLVYGSQLGERVSTIVPATMLSKDIDITYASQVLVLISQGHSTLLSALNPNSQILWHSLCIMLTVNVQTLEDAAGRRGSQRESTALKEIKTWAATPAARRACLHAAQIYYILSNCMLAHHTMIHSETGLFHAALAISLYIWAMPRSTEDQAISDESDDKALELLDSFDWVSMGCEGFILADEKSCSLPDDTTSGRLVGFVRHGDQLSFSGLCLRGGHQCARRVLLDYNVLLQRVSRYLGSGFHEILDFLGERLME